MNRRMKMATLGLVCAAMGWGVGQFGTSWLYAQPVGGGAFAITQLGLANGSRELIRTNASTGESWRLVGNEWSPVPEDGRPGAGEYEVMMLAAAESRFWALRFDRASGKAWNLSEGKWTPMTEMRPQPETPQPQP